MTEVSKETLEVAYQAISAATIQVKDPDFVVLAPKVAKAKAELEAALKDEEDAVSDD